MCGLGGRVPRNHYRRGSTSLVDLLQTLREATAMPTTKASRIIREYLESEIDFYRFTAAASRAAAA
jgi:hypothetical protein